MKKSAKIILNTLALTSIFMAVGCDFMSDPVDPWGNGGNGHGGNGGGCGDTVIVDTLWDDHGDGGWGHDDGKGDGNGGGDDLDSILTKRP